MRGLFSLIQFCPDLGRMECANVGVVLVVVPYQAYLKMSPTNDVPRRRGFSFDDARLTLAKIAIANRFEREAPSWTDSQELQSFRSREGNNLILTAPKTVLFEDPEKTLEELYSELVAI